MLIQPVNTDNRTNFKAIKGIKYSSFFNPKEDFDDARIVDKVLRLDAIKKLAEKYDFIIKFYRDVSSSYDSVYSLTFKPSPFHVLESYINKLSKIFKNLFNKEAAQISEKHEVPNLPCEFEMCYEIGKNNFNRSIEKITEPSIYKEMKETIEKKQELVKKKAEHKQLLKNIQQNINGLDIK